jgi:hypothetical protein
MNNNIIADNPYHVPLNLRLFDALAPAGTPAPAAPASAPDPAPAGPAPAAPASAGEPTTGTGTPGSGDNPLLNFLQSGSGARKYQVPGVNVTPTPAPGSQQPSTVVSQPASPAQSVPSTGQPAAQPGQPAQHGQPAQPATAQPEELILGKFRTTEDVIKAFPELEKKLGQQGTELGELRRKLAEFEGGAQPSGQPAQPGQPAQGGPQQPQIPELTPEQIKDLNAKFVETMLDPDKNPLELLGNIVNNMLAEGMKNIEGRIAPVEQRFAVQDYAVEYNQAVDQFKTNGHDDWDQLKPELVQIAQQYGPILSAMPAEQAIETAYNMAKANKVANMRPAPTLEEMLKDPQTLQQIAQNPELKNLILQNVGSEIRSGNIPTVIGGQPTGTAPVASSEPIRTTKDATRAAVGFFNRFMGGGGS